MADEALIKEIDAYVDEVWSDVLHDMAALIAHNSVVDASKAQDGAPFGPAAHDALTCALGIAEKLGLEPHDFKGYLGYADLKGASDTYISTIAHVDIVPAGTGWTVEPFELTQKDGYLLGRGVLDDKGPAILTLYAAHFFARKGQQLPYTLRCMLGSDEGSGHERRGALPGRVPRARVLLHARCRVPRVLRREGPLRRDVRLW